MSTQHPKEFTGRHMLVIMLCFFATIITVNLALAIAASTSWTGFVVKNSYVASQQFNERVAESRAQAALGWTSRVELQNGEVRYRLSDATGSPVDVTGVHVTFRRPVAAAEDMALDLARSGRGDFKGPVALPDGVWILESDADVGSDKPYRRAERIVIRGGVIQ